MERQRLTAEIVASLDRSPVVALLGPRQSGKTTLARHIARYGPLPCDEGLNYFDLEDPAHVERLATPRLAMEPLRGLVPQRKPSRPALARASGVLALPDLLGLLGE